VARKRPIPASVEAIDEEAPGCDEEEDDDCVMIGFLLVLVSML